MIMRSLAGMKVKEKEKKDPLGRWNSFQIEGNNRVLKVITVCRIPESTSSVIIKSRVQHDRSRGEVKTSREHREELLTQLSEEVRQSNVEKLMTC